MSVIEKEIAQDVVPVGYKKTEVGVIPNDWDVFSIGDSLVVIDGDRGVNYPCKSDFNLHGYCVFLSAENVTKNGFRFSKIEFITEDKDKLLRKGKLKRKDIVLTTRGSVGHLAMYDYSVGYNHLRINSGMVLIRDELNNYDYRWLYCFLNSEIARKQIDVMSFGSAQPQLTVAGINKILIIAPSEKKEQVGIANALSDVDALINELEKLIAKKQSIKTATMQQLLTGRTRLPQFAYREDGSKKGYKQSDLGEIPEDWDIVNLNSVCSSFKTGKLDANAMRSDGEYRFYTCAREYYYIDTYAFDTEALLISGNGANVGYIHYYKGKFNAYQRTYVLSEFSASVGYLKIYLERKLSDRIRVEVNSGNTPYITMDTLTDMLIVTPGKFDEQIAISSILSDMNTEIELLDQRLSKTRQIKQGMMQELLTGKTRILNRK